MHQGADIRIPKVFYFIMKYVTPVYLLALMILWPIQDLGKVLNPEPNITEAIKGRAALKGLVKVAYDHEELVPEIDRAKLELKEAKKAADKDRAKAAGDKIDRLSKELDAFKK
jgi:hypothetical protein